MSDVRGHWKCLKILVLGEEASGAGAAAWACVWMRDKPGTGQASPSPMALHALLLLSAGLFVSFFNEGDNYHLCKELQGPC